MRLGDIDLSLRPKEVSLFLAKPDRKIFSPLKDIYNVSYSVKISTVNELNFTIPTKIERNHQLIDNPLIDMIKHRYLVKLEYNDQVDYLVFLEQNKSYSSSGEEISYRLYSEGYLLADKEIRDLEVVSKTPSFILSTILEETIWKIAYVDPVIDAQYRSHEIASQTVLQALYEISEKFNGVLVWDTVNFIVRLYHPDNIGRNRGLKFKEGKYLESFSVNTNSEEIVTRLKVYGKDGLSIRSLTPTGANYIEDFSYFMYPFERNSSGTVIKQSFYMSDSLCIALENYSKKLANAQGAFETYLKNVGLKQDNVQQLQQELAVLTAELKTLQDAVDVLNADGKSGTPAHATALQNRNSKQTQVTTKKSQISILQNDIKTLDTNWSTLRSGLVIDANLNAAQLVELNKYIIVKEHTNDTIIDEKDLLKEAIETFQTLKEPKVNLTLDIINFLSIVDAQHDWHKLSLGDTVIAESKRMQVEVESKITEIEYDFDADSINLVIANSKQVKDDNDKWMEQIYNAGQTATQLSANKFKWDMIEEANSVINQLLNTAWDATKNGILAGHLQDISIDERGITIRSPHNRNNMLVIQSGVLAISNDGGDTFKNALTTDGLVAERILGKLILSSRMIIEDVNGIIRFTGSLQEIFDAEGNVKVAIGEYATGKYGMKINSGALEIVGGIDSSHVNPEFLEDIVYDETGIRNDLRLTAPLPSSLTLNSSGITAFTANTSNFARMDYRGLYIQGGAVDIRTGSLSNRGVIFDGSGIRGYNSLGVKTFEIDTNGYLMASTGEFSGSLKAATGTFSGNLSAAGGTFSGNLSAAGGTFSGSLTAATGTFKGSLQAATGTFSGDLSAAGGTFSGTLSAVSGTFTSLTSGTISGSTITGSNITGTNFTLASSGVLNLSQGTIIWGENVPKDALYARNAGNANLLNGQYTAADFSRNGHNHSNLYVHSNLEQNLRLHRDNSTGRIVVTENGINRGTLAWY